VVVLVVGMHELHITGQEASTSMLFETVPQLPCSSLRQNGGSGNPLQVAVVVVVVLVVHVPQRAGQLVETSKVPVLLEEGVPLLGSVNCPQSLSESAAHSSASGLPLHRRAVVAVVVAVVVTVETRVEVPVDSWVEVAVDVAVEVAVLCVQLSYCPVISNNFALSSKSTSALHASVS